MSGRTLGKWLPVVCAVGLALPLKSASGAPDSGVVQPPVLLLPNYGRILIGSQGGMEAGALVVRAKATEAAWYNPAGLVRSKWNSFSANASLYQLVKTDFVSGSTTATSSNVTTLPVFVGVSNWITTGDTERGKLAWGYTIVTPVAWQSDVGSFDEFAYNGGVDRVTTESHTDYNTLGIGAVLSYAVTAPYAPPPRLTVGVSAGLYMSELGIQTSKFDDWNETATGTAYTKSHQLDYTLSAKHLGITLGAYYGFAENWESALIVRLPGIKLSATGDYDEHELRTGDALAPDYYASDSHDAGIEADWKIPLELTAGIAFNGDKFDAEIDLSYHAGTGTYDVLPAGLYALRQGPLSGLVSSTAARDPLTTTGDSILNVAFGCRYEINEKYRLHAGFRTCKSHVEATAAEDIFQSIDLYMVTFGLSTQTSNTFTSLGIALGFGSTDHFTLQDVASGNPVGGSLEVSTTSFFIGASFKL